MARRTGARGDAGGVVFVRVSRDEMKRLRSAAERDGLGVGPWLRMAGLREADRQAPPLKPARP